MPTDKTPVSDHVHTCVKLLNERMKRKVIDPGHIGADRRREAFESVFELMDLPWDEHTEEDGMFREGYETCLLDVVDAIAQAWGVTLPKLEVHNERSK